MVALPICWTQFMICFFVLFQTGVFQNLDFYSKVMARIRKGLNIERERGRERIKISSFGILPCYNLHNWYYSIVIINSPILLEIQDLSKRKEHLLTMFPNTSRIQFMRTETSLLLDLAFPLTNLASFQTQLHCFQVRAKNWNRVYDLSVGFFFGWKHTSRHHGEMSWLDVAPSQKLGSALLWLSGWWPTAILPCFRTAWNTSKTRVFTSAWFFRAWPTIGRREAVLRNVSDWIWL